MKTTTAGSGLPPKDIRSKPCVLMVDDDVDFLEIARSWLARDYDFYGLHSAAELANHLSRIVPDVAILDLYMPGEDGFELCRRIHTSRGCKSVPVIFLTASEKLEDYRKNMSAGGATYLRKPVSRLQLLSAIASLMPQPSLQDDGGGD